MTRCLLAQVCTLSAQKSDHAVTLSGNNVLCLLTLEVFVTVWYIYLVLVASLSTIFIFQSLPSPANGAAYQGIKVSIRHLIFG